MFANLNESSIKKIKLWGLSIALVLSVSLITRMIVGPQEDLPPYTKEQKQTIENEMETRWLHVLSGRRPSVPMQNNVPNFAGVDGSKDFEQFSPLDDLGRCGPVLACIGPDTLAAEKPAVGNVPMPTGWHDTVYDNLHCGYLYTITPLIDPRFSAQGCPKENSITGTYYLQCKGLEPYTDEIANYIENTGNHVLYRATPLFITDDLVARGIELEALSVEDQGDGISFHVFCYNLQPGAEIYYPTGESVQVISRHQIY